MINELTEYQQSQIAEYHKKYLDYGTSTSRINIDECTKTVNEIYSMHGYKQPKIIYCDSPFSCQILINFFQKNILRNLFTNSLGDSLASSLRNSLMTSLWASLVDSLASSLQYSIRASLTDSLGASIEHSLGDSLQTSLWASLRHSLTDSLVDSLRSSLGASIEHSLGGSLQGSLGDSLEYYLRDSLESSLGDSLEYYLRDSLESSLGDSLASSLRNSLRHSIQSSLETSLRASLQDSLWASLRTSLGDSLVDSLVDSLPGSLGEPMGDSLESSLQASLRDSIKSSLGHSLQDFLGTSLWDSLRNSLGDSLGHSLQVSLETSLRNYLVDSLETSLRDSLEASLRDSLVESLQTSLWASLRQSLTDSLQDSLGEFLKDKELSYIFTCFWGRIDLYWIAFYKYCEDILKIQYSEESSNKLNIIEKLSKQCNFIYFFQNYVFISQSPIKINAIENYKKLHSETEAAMKFADGYSIFAINGRLIPEYIITHPEQITIDKIHAEENAEVRRIMIRKMGEEKYLNDSNAKLIDSNTKFGDLYIIKSQNNDENIAFVKVKNSTPEPDGSYKYYYLQTPPECKTAKEAVAWTFDIEENEYNPFIET